MRSGDVLEEKYRLEKRLGTGGMGEVWSATHLVSGRDFAIKVMHAHAASSVSARQRFSREARVSAKIHHPCVIGIFDVGATEDGGLYLVMELLEGVTLADVIHGSPTLTLHDFVSVMADTASALVAAHAASIIHRDVKPSNIFLYRDRVTGLYAPKVLDFGISKFTGAHDSNATRAGTVLGSPRYMSPEQTRSAADADARADIWAVGVILFEGLTGTYPHDGDSFSSLVVAICTKPPASIDVLAPAMPESIRSIVRDCLKPLDTRIATAAELTARLEAALDDPSLAQVYLPPPRAPAGEGIRPAGGVSIRPRAAHGYAAGVVLPAPLPPPRPPGAPYATPVPHRSGAAMPLAQSDLEEFAAGTQLPAASVVSQGAPTATRPDPLIGTASTMSVEAAGMSAGAVPPLQPAVPAEPPPTKPAASANSRLRIATAVLGVLLVAAVVALVALLQRRPLGAVSPAPSLEASALSLPDVKSAEKGAPIAPIASESEGTPPPPVPTAEPTEATTPTAVLKATTPPAHSTTRPPTHVPSSKPTSGKPPTRPGVPAPKSSTTKGTLPRTATKGK
jgi:serine/threonine protein kinase